MDWLAVGISVDTSSVKAECTDQEIVSRWNVLVSQKGDYPLECRHEFLRFHESA